MTTTHIRSTMLPTPLAHEHAWLTESRHPTSEGLVVYVRCIGCDARRVDLQPHPLAPPEALSRATTSDEP